MEIMQSINQAIDVADWPRDEELAEYPEGARDKTLLYCPKLPSYKFLTKHRYLFKRSSPRYIEQFWVEIISYWLGIKMNIPVPPAFVAYDSQNGQSGALIEWFLNNNETYIPGGDYCQQYIPDFDRKKGKQHNFETIDQIFRDLSKQHSNFQADWKNYWAKIFTFDALIGNTDRHQDNWGVIVTPANDGMRISPVFDNGTSMGHEIFPDKFKFFEDKNRLEKYVLKGRHHIKWSLNDTKPIEHLELLKKLINKYPETKIAMLDCSKIIHHGIFEDILNDIVKFEVPVRLTLERAEFMLKLFQYRHQRLLIELEK